MKPRMRMALFVLGATAANILLMALLFIVLMALYSWTLAPMLPPEAVVWAVPAGFLLALVLGMLIYRQVLRVLRTRWNLDSWLAGGTGR